MGFYVEGVTITCCIKDCGISFQVPGWWEKGKRETHATFYCPNGHGQHFSGESDADKFRRERDIAKQQLARAEQEAADARARAELLNKQKRRLEKRASAGTCPCCTRTFTNMSRHMKTKHPEFIAENVVPMKKKA